MTKLFSLIDKPKKPTNCRKCNKQFDFGGDDGLIYNDKDRTFTIHCSGCNSVYTENILQISISMRNHKIISILKLEGQTSSRELAERLGLKESTILVELRYLEKLGVVQEVLGK